MSQNSVTMKKQENNLRQSEYLHTLERGLKVLNCFDHNTPSMKLSEVAKASDLSPAVARRCLNTLIHLGYIAQHDRQFMLKPKVLELGSAFIDSMNLDTTVSPHLQALREATGDSASLAVLSGQDILYLVHVTTNRPFRLRAGAGTRFPAHATSLGRVILAFMPDQDIQEFLSNAPFDKLTSNTLNTRDELSRRFKHIREKGFETAQDELDYGIISIAAPIFDKERRVVAAINCSTSTSRTDKNNIVETRIDLLRKCADEVEISLKRWPFLFQSLSH